MREPVFANSTGPIRCTIGPLAVLGAFADGLHGDLGLLAVKSLLDGFAMLTVVQRS